MSFPSRRVRAIVVLDPVAGRVVGTVGDQRLFGSPAGSRLLVEEIFADDCPIVAAGPTGRDLPLAACRLSGAHHVAGLVRPDRVKGDRADWAARGRVV